MGKDGLHLEDPNNAGQWLPVVGEPNRSLPVTLQDQTTPTFYMRSIIESAQFVLESDVVQGEYTFDALNTHGIDVVNNNYIEFYNQIRWIQAQVLSIAVDTPTAGTDRITIDQPFDYAYASETTVCYSGSEELAVNGSGDVKIARITNKHLVLDWDITRVNIYIEDTTAMDHSLFGNISKLTRGVLWRFYSELGDWNYFNGYNAKTNGELADILNFWNYVDKSGGGLFSFEGHKLLGGQSNLGVVVRLVFEDQDEMQVLLQDALQTLQHFHIHFEGSVVIP